MTHPETLHLVGHVPRMFWELVTPLQVGGRKYKPWGEKPAEKKHGEKPAEKKHGEKPRNKSEKEAIYSSSPKI